jgi:predicted CoA-binding protein
MSEKEIKKILAECKTIAVVGLSREPQKDSHRVSEYMQKQGYRIIPVNPFADEVLGEKSYKSLLDIPEELQKAIDIVDVFRKPDDTPPVAEQTAKLKQKWSKPDVFWMQLGIVNEQAAEMAEKAGMTIVMDMCIMQEHKRLIR